MSDDGKLFDTGRLIVWSAQLEGYLFDTLGGGAWLNGLGTQLLSKHTRGAYGERTQQHKKQNADAIRGQVGAVASRYQLPGGPKAYVITLFPLPSEPHINQTYLVSDDDYEEFQGRVLQGRVDQKSEMKRMEKERAKTRKNNRKRAAELQGEIAHVAEYIHEY